MCKRAKTKYYYFKHEKYRVKLDIVLMGKQPQPNVKLQK